MQSAAGRLPVQREMGKELRVGLSVLPARCSTPRHETWEVHSALGAVAAHDVATGGAAMDWHIAASVAEIQKVQALMDRRILGHTRRDPAATAERSRDRRKWETGGTGQVFRVHAARRGH